MADMILRQKMLLNRCLYGDGLGGWLVNTSKHTFRLIVSNHYCAEVSAFVIFFSRSMTDTTRCRQLNHPVQSDSAVPLPRLPSPAQVVDRTCALSGALSEQSSPPPPEFIAARNELWLELKQQHDAFVQRQPRSPIHVTLPDGTVEEGKAWETTPMHIGQRLK